MRIFCTTLLLLISIGPVFSCLCFPPNFCKYVEDTKDDATTLIFKGSYLEEEELGHGKAIKYKVEKIYNGEVVTPNSSYYTGETYVNTDSTIWLLAGSDAACLRYLENRTAIFIVTYNTGWPSLQRNFGYVPTVCASDYFPISDNDEVTGLIWKRSEEETMPLSEFEDLLKNGCGTSSTDDSIDGFDQLRMYPNPVNDLLHIHSPAIGIGNALQIALYDTQGLLMKRAEGTFIDMNNLSPGVYFVKIFNEESTTYTKKVIKI